MKQSNKEGLEEYTEVEAEADALVIGEAHKPQSDIRVISVRG